MKIRDLAGTSVSEGFEEVGEVVRNGVEAAGVAVVLDWFEVLDGFRDFGAGDFFRIFQDAGAVDHRGEFG
jgi:hypothetical protein